MQGNITQGGRGHVPLAKSSRQAPCAQVPVRLGHARPKGQAERSIKPSHRKGQVCSHGIPPLLKSVVETLRYRNNSAGSMWRCACKAARVDRNAMIIVTAAPPASKAGVTS